MQRKKKEKLLDIKHLFINVDLTFARYNL